MTKPKEYQVRLPNGDIVRLTLAQQQQLLAAAKRNIRAENGDATAERETFVIVNGSGG